jgi:hypothetical protein
MIYSISGVYEGLVLALELDRVICPSVLGSECDPGDCPSLLLVDCEEVMTDVVTPSRLGPKRGSFVVPNLALLAFQSRERPYG